MKRHRLVIRIAALTLLLASLLPLAAHAVPGEVLSEQKISNTVGGLVGPLADVDEFGFGAAAIGDVDGDGVDDLAVGAWRDGASDHGAVWILFLDTDGSVKAEQKIDQTNGGFGGTLSSFGNFGATIASLGDLDGDGIVDIAVSAHNDDLVGTNRGAVWILFLDSDGTVKAEQRIDGVSGGFGGVLDNQDAFGFGLSAIGDLDGDGTTELAVGAFGDDDGAPNIGAVWILFLLPDGTVHHQQKISALSGGFPAGLATNDRFGVRSVGLGDLDGDGVPDLAIGADSDDDDGTDSGAVWVTFLKNDGTVKSATKITGHAGAGDLFGLAVAAPGDLNGDGLPDLAVGAQYDDDGGTDRGAVWVFSLSATGSATLLQKISDTSGGFAGVLDDGDLFGGGVTGLSRFGTSANGGLMVGAYRDGDGGTGRGAVWLLELDGSSLICGNGVLDPVEECDDGNTSDFDGCTAVCEFEDDLRILGVAENMGLLTAEIDEVAVNVAVLPGDSPETLSGLLATIVDYTPALTSTGVEALEVGSRVFTNGTINGATISAAGSSVSVTPGRVLDFQKISATQGNFNGELEQTAFFGISAAAVGDLDGDGVTDLAVGIAKEVPIGEAEKGALWILLLNADGTVKLEQRISDVDGGFSGPLNDYDFFGSGLAAAGDRNGDGIPDLAVGAYGDNDGGAGAVWILYLNFDGTVKGYRKISILSGGFTGSLDHGDSFGSSVASLGDLDGDGLGDFAVGASLDDDGGLNRGAVWILFTNPDGTVKGSQKISSTQGSFTGTLDDGGRFGESVSSLGDVDGDGVVDLAVGEGRGLATDQPPGSVWILLLNANGTVKSHQRIGALSGGFKGPLELGDQFGASLASLGDLDGDGTPDLAVGATSDDDGGTSGLGAVWMLFLNADGTVKHHVKVSATQGGFTGELNNNDLFGSSLALLGDLAGNGHAVLATGAISDDDGPSLGLGAVWLLELDSAATAACGDTFVVAPETCDDGNMTPGDGCYSTCEIEDELTVSGEAQGGVVVAVVSDIAILIVTNPGQSAATVASNLASVVNITPALLSAAISSVPIGPRVVSNGTFDSAVSTDPGLVITVPEPGSLLGLGSGIVLLMGLARRRREAR